MSQKLIRIKLQNIRSVLPEMVIVWQSAKQYNLVCEQYLYEHSFRTHTEQLPNDSSVRLVCLDIWDIDSMESGKVHWVTKVLGLWPRICHLSGWSYIQEA